MHIWIPWMLFILTQPSSLSDEPTRTAEAVWFRYDLTVLNIHVVFVASVLPVFRLCLADLISSHDVTDVIDLGFPSLVRAEAQCFGSFLVTKATDAKFGAHVSTCRCITRFIFIHTLDRTDKQASKQASKQTNKQTKQTNQSKQAGAQTIT